MLRSKNLFDFGINGVGLWSYVKKIKLTLYRVHSCIQELLQTSRSFEQILIHTKKHPPKKRLINKKKKTQRKQAWPIKRLFLRFHFFCSQCGFWADFELFTGIQISSDLDTDTEIDLPMGKRSQDKDDDDDFDFYGWIKYTHKHLSSSNGYEISHYLYNCIHVYEIHKCL